MTVKQSHGTGVAGYRYKGLVSEAVPEKRLDQCVSMSHVLFKTR